MPTFDRQDRYAPEKAYSRIIWGKRSKVLEVELTEMQKIMQRQIEALGEKLLSNGFLTLPALNYTGGVLTVPASSFVIDGGVYNIQDPMTIAVSNGQTVYLAASEVEVSYTDTIKRDGNLSGGQNIADNGMLDPELGGLETSRRAQRQVQLVTDNSDPNKKYLVIGTVSGGSFVDQRTISSIYSATSAATPNTIIQRDPSGRAKVAAPSEADDIARKDTVDNSISVTMNAHQSSEAPHQYGGRFEWRYNSALDALELVVIE